MSDCEKCVKAGLRQNENVKRLEAENRALRVENSKMTAKAIEAQRRTVFAVMLLLATLAACATVMFFK